MRYWLTTHWPPRATGRQYITHVYVQGGLEAAGRALAPGDKVLIYESKTGPIITKQGASAQEIRHVTGRCGIVAVAEATTPLLELAGSQPTTYEDGTVRDWRWRAETPWRDEAGFVPLSVVNRVMGYKAGCRLRGFGTLHSGLKELTAAQYAALLDEFKRHPRAPLPWCAPLRGC